MWNKLYKLMEHRFVYLKIIHCGHRTNYDPRKNKNKWINLSIVSKGRMTTKSNKTED
jgi:hypothetical protein